MKKVHLFQVNFTMGVGALTSNWIPYSAGCVWAYISQNEELMQHYTLAELHYRREPLEELLDRLDSPDVCGFSSYTWNINYNLIVSKAIKKKWPNCKIVFGGPGVENNTFNFFMRHPWIDSAITSEGEVSFENLLTDLATTGKIKKHYSSERIKDLNIPSPYLLGLFDDMVNDSDVLWSATLETNRGCPFSCTFCDWGGGIHTKIKKFPIEKVFAELEWMAQHKIEYLLIADANFTIFADRDLDIVKKIVDCRKTYGYPKTMNTSYNKNNSVKVIETVKLLQEHGLSRGVTLSVQSNTDSVLTAIKRKNMEMSKLGDIYDACNKQGIAYYTELILGLPEESFTTWKEGLCNALEFGCHGALDTYFLSILVNSELAQDVPKYGLKIKTFSFVHSGDESKIPESTSLIVGSNTMSTDDWMKSHMFGWMIINYHSYGWTQIITRYINLKHGVPFIKMYEDLYEYVQQSPLLSERFVQEIQMMKLFVESDESEIVALEKSWIELIKISKANVYLHDHRTEVLDTLDPWYRKWFVDEPQEFIDELVRYQRLFPIDSERSDSWQETFSFDIFPYLNKMLTNIEHSPVTFNISTVDTWKTKNNFNEYITYRARSGFPKHVFKKV